ncbi:uncharacterized protein TNCV_85741 [Trichonephila clavipes]|nr:uncharacterized protein TNCV_85741 [Trichonephila clavipes]
MEILKEKPPALDEKLEKAIYSKTKVLYRSTKESTSFNKIVKQEMQLFDSTENSLSDIIKLYEVLKTIPPTSVEGERAFSAAGLFVTKLRTRRSDKSIRKRAMNQNRSNRILTQRDIETALLFHYRPRRRVLMGGRKGTHRKPPT